MLQSIAGSESALAFYDIGKLAFLCLTRLPSSNQSHRDRAMAVPIELHSAQSGTDFYV